MIQAHAGSTGDITLRLEERRGTCSTRSIFQEEEEAIIKDAAEDDLGTFFGCKSKRLVAICFINLAL